MLKSTLSESIFIRLAVVGSENYEILQNSDRIRAYRRSRSPEVIDLVANRKRICDFLSVITSNFRRISYHFRDNWALSVLGARDVIGHVTIQLPISYWWFFGTKPLPPAVSEIFSGECYADVEMTSNKRPRSFILVPINSSYTTSYRLSIVTFALRRTV